MEKGTPGIRPMELTNVGALRVFGVPLVHGAMDYGMLGIACAYDDEDMGTMRTLHDTEPKTFKLSVSIICKTVIGGVYHSADDVCHFAAKLLEAGYGLGNGKITIDVSKLSVQYEEETSTRNVAMNALYSFALDILTAYALRFEGEVRAIPGGVEPMSETEAETSVEG